MKKYSLIIVSLVLFILNNTTYFWGRTGFFIGVFFVFITLIGFALLAVLILFQCYFIYKEKFSKKIRLVNLLLLTFTFVYCSIFPNIIDFDSRIYGRRIFYAFYEGSANCTVNLILREKNRFTKSSICFGITEEHGDYEIRNDSIFVTYDNTIGSNYKAYLGVIIKDSNKHKDLPDKVYLYNNDTLIRPLKLTVTKNELY